MSTRTIKGPRGPRPVRPADLLAAITRVEMTTIERGQAIAEHRRAQLRMAIVQQAIQRHGGRVTPEESTALRAAREGEREAGRAAARAVRAALEAEAEHQRLSVAVQVGALATQGIDAVID